MIKRTIVIGNGFDLNLGLATSYKDFIKSTIFKSLSSSNGLCKYLKAQLRRFNWVDVEVALVEYSQQNVPSQIFCREYNELRNALTQYLSNLNWKTMPSTKPAYCFLTDKLKDSNDNKNIDTTILNFNYSDTVDCILGEFKKQHKIEDSSTINVTIKHVHGILKNNSLVLGYNGYASISDQCVFIKKETSDSFVSCNEYLDNCTELYIFGHSLGESDERIFQPFFNSLANGTTLPPMIQIHYYKQEGLESLQNRMKEMTNNQLQKFKYIEYINVERVAMHNDVPQSLFPYNVPITINLPHKRKAVKNVKIEETDTVQRVLNKIFYLLDGAVAPFEYMNTWVLRERNSGAYMIMYEVTTMVPAKNIFRPELKWEVVQWDGTYTTANSRFHGGLLEW